ncbi:MAG: hypothetical protein WDO15_25615 [Bacteroidota bacterium]
MLKTVHGTLNDLVAFDIGNGIGYTDFRLSAITNYDYFAECCAAFDEGDVDY